MFGKTFTKKFCRQLHHNLFCICTVAISISNTFGRAFNAQSSCLSLFFTEMSLNHTGSTLSFIDKKKRLHTIILETHFNPDWFAMLWKYVVCHCMLDPWNCARTVSTVTELQNQQRKSYVLCDLSICLIIVLTGDNPPGFISSSDRVARLYRLI